MAPPAQFGGDGERAPLLNAPSASSRDASSSKSRFYAALAVLGACAVVAVAAVGTGACPPTAIRATARATPRPPPRPTRAPAIAAGPPARGGGPRARDPKPRIPPHLPQGRGRVVTPSILRTQTRE